MSTIFRPGILEALSSLDGRNVREALLQVDEVYRAALELFYLSNIRNWRNSRNTDLHGHVEVVEGQSATQIDPLNKFLWR
jgi:hypothetical protein